MTHSSRRMPRALCDGRAGGRRAMGLRRGRAHANAKEGETNRGRAAKKKGREGGKRHRARGAHGQCHGNVQRRPKQRRQTGRVGRAGCGRHADGTRKDGGSAHCSPLSVAREGVVGSASNPHRCRHAAGPCRTRRATDATRRVTFRRTRRARRDDASDARCDPGRLHRSDSNIERTPHGRGLSRRAFRARREQCSPRRHERAFQTSVRRARRGPSAAPGRFSPRSAIRPSA
ncbi:hypothetical protein BG19_2604 [Burkholderia pseudomallei MSHR840]|nr:hypothetical protein BG19_2604 [Burkholderia pseudomallei MSHR840]